jgi:hypothetical protein
MGYFAMNTASFRAVEASGSIVEAKMIVCSSMLSKG